MRRIKLEMHKITDYKVKAKSTKLRKQGVLSNINLSLIKKALPIMHMV